VKRSVVLAAVLVLLSTLFVPGLALAQSFRAPVTKYASRFDAVNPPTQLDQVSLVLDFAPGVWTPPHAHGGQTFVTVAEGELTVRERGAERKVKAGENWVQSPGSLVEVGNAGTAKARTLVSVLLPKGAPLTTDQAGAGSQNPPAGPTTLYRATLDVRNPVMPLEVVQLLVEFPTANSWTPWHTHAGQGFVIVTEGEITVQRASGDEKIGTGNTWVEAPDVVHRAGAVTGPSAVFGSILQAKGAAITTLQPGQTGLAPAAAAPAQLPRTGSVDHSALAAVAAALVAGGWALRQRRAGSR
jgi:quercetin dioxygenase-like cupin family protein